MLILGNITLVVMYTYANTHLGDSLEVCLDTLLLLLHEQVSPKWREFGEAVEIDDMVLDSIASTCSPENHFVELLDYWLKYYDGKPTWSDIAEALYDIDLQKVAQDIKHVYETGKKFGNLLNKLHYEFLVPHVVNPNTCY